MDNVKFVPPGGHRACLSCSAAKAKCVFSDDAEVGELSGVSFGAGGDSSDFIHSSGGDPSAASPSSSAPVEGTPAIPRCQRCERLNRDCLLPTRPRKKRRVGTLKPGTSHSGAAGASSKSSPSSVSTAGKSGGFGGTSIFSTKKPPIAGVGHPGSSSTSKIPSLSKFPVHSGSSGGTIRKGSTSSHPQSSRSPLVAPQSTFHRSSNQAASPPFMLQPQYPPGRSPKREPGTPSSLPSISSIAASVPGSATGPSSFAPIPPGDSIRFNPYGRLSAAPSSSHAPHGQSHGQAPPQQSPRQSPQMGTSSVPGPHNPHQILINSVFSMREREAEELLRFYRDAYSRFNPYMDPPPPNMKVSQLQAQKPLVWLSIVFVTSFHDFERQTRLGKAIVFYVSDQVFQNNAKSLDLLQGLLIFLNWFIAQNFVLPQFTNLIHLAMALVTDLGLNKLEFSRTSARSPLDRYIAKTIHGPGLRAPVEGHTLNERRALAGGFCLSHAMSDSIIMVTPLHYTLQLEDTCRFFEASYAHLLATNAPITAAATADYHLAISVRLYHLIGRVLQVQRDADLREGRFMTPVRTQIDAFVNELEHIWEDLPPETQSDFKIQLLYHTAEIYIYELSLSASTTPFKMHSTPSKDSDDGTTPDGDMPIRCYISTKKFFDIYLTLPVSLYHQFPVTLFTQLVHADLTLAKLTAYFRGNTQPFGVPAGITLPGFAEVIDAVASRFQRVRTVSHPLGYPVRNIIYDAFAARLRSFKVLDLAGRRKNAKAAAAAQRAQQAQQAHQAPQAHSMYPTYTAETSPPQQASVSTRTTPTSGGMMSIDNLIGNVPQRPIDPDKPYASVEMDIDGDNTQGDNFGRGSVVDTDPLPSEMDMMEMSNSDMEEQAEWWAWFGDLQSSLLVPAPTSTTAGGSVSGASVTGGGQDDNAYEAPRRPGGPGSVGSIDSLLNNNDQEPNYDVYMQQRKY